MSKRRILVLDYMGYGEALNGLGKLSADCKHFFAEPKDFHLVLFTGGSDVDPATYGDTSPHGLCTSNPPRDLRELAVFKTAQENGIMMTGICRGIQFLNCMAGGKLFHHVSNHAGRNHLMETSRFGEAIVVNSLHHQMVIPKKGSSIVVGWSTPKLSDVYIGKHDREKKWLGQEPEAAIFPKIRACGVQYHPEAMWEDAPGYQFYWNMVKDMLTMDMDSYVKLYLGKAEMGHDVP